MMARQGVEHSLPLLFQETYVFIRRGPADIAEPRQFCQVERSLLILRIVPKEVSGNIVKHGLRSADSRAFRPRVPHIHVDTLH